MVETVDIRLCHNQLTDAVQVQVRHLAIYKEALCSCGQLYTHRLTEEQALPKVEAIKHKKNHQ
jgi:hypothetical protein